MSIICLFRRHYINVFVSKFLKAQHYLIDKINAMFSREQIKR